MDLEHHNRILNIAAEFWTSYNRILNITFMNITLKSWILHSNIKHHTRIFFYEIWELNGKLLLSLICAIFPNLVLKVLPPWYLLDLAYKFPPFHIACGSHVASMSCVVLHILVLFSISLCCAPKACGCIETYRVLHNLDMVFLYLVSSLGSPSIIPPST